MPRRSRSSPPMARTFGAGSSRVTPCLLASLSTLAATPRKSRSRSQIARWPREWTIVAVQLPRVRRERRDAGRARAHLRRARDLRCGRGTRRGRSEPHRHVRAEPRDRPRDARCRDATGRGRGARLALRQSDSHAATTTTRGCRSSLLLRHRFDAQGDASRSRMPLLAVVARIATRSFRSSGRARCMTPGRGPSAGA